MAATIVERRQGRGRQSAAVEEQRDFREELTAERAEGGMFAARVAYLGELIRNGGIVAGEFAIAELGTELEGLANRRLRQIRGVAL